MYILHLSQEYVFSINVTLIQISMSFVFLHYNGKYQHCLYRSLKITRPDSSQNFMDTAKTIFLSRLCIQISNTVVFFQLYKHQTYKEIQNKNHVNSKPKVLNNKLFRISRFRTTDIYRRTFRLGQ